MIDPSLIGNFRYLVLI